MKDGFMYILQCVDGSFYTGSTTNLNRRLTEHQLGVGANHTKKRLPVTLVYFEAYDWIGDAFAREKQIQKWTRRKKEALISLKNMDLPKLAKKKRKRTSTLVENRQSPPVARCHSPPFAE